MGGAQRPSAVPAHSTGCPRFGADGRCQLEHGSLACSLHAAGLTGFSSASAKGFCTRAAIHAGSWCHCLPPLLTIAASFVAQPLLNYNGFATKFLLKHLSLVKASRIKQIIALPEKIYLVQWLEMPCKHLMLSTANEIRSREAHTQNMKTKAFCKC